MFRVQNVVRQDADSERRLARRVRELFTELGPTYIKLGCGWSGSGGGHFNSLHCLVITALKAEHCSVVL